MPVTSELNSQKDKVGEERQKVILTLQEAIYDSMCLPRQLGRQTIEIVLVKTPPKISTSNEFK